jgi:hypothetical protein
MAFPHFLISAVIVYHPVCLRLRGLTGILAYCYFNYVHEI